MTPVNGFDKENKDNAKQNNYAWSIDEFDDYIYVGIGRNIELLFQKENYISVTEAVKPKKQIYNGEIWGIHKNSENKNWERIYRAPTHTLIFGFPKMLTYTDQQGKCGLVVGCIGLDKHLVILTTFDGKNFEFIPVNEVDVSEVQAMVQYQGKLYFSIKK